MLDSLPPEVIAHIILFLDLVSIRRCQQLCRTLTEVIKDSPYIQHLLELENLDYVEPINRREDLSHAERMREFRRHKDCLLNPDVAEISWINLESSENRTSSLSYGLYPGVLVCPTSPGETPFAHPRRGLRCYQLLSRNHGVAQKSWVFDDVGVDYVNYVADMELDLLVLFERIPEAGDGKLHLRSLRYGTEHPGALRTTLNYTPQTRNQSRLIINAQVDRKVLAMTIIIKSSILQLVVWDWTTGAELTDITLHTEKFLFASETMFATLERTIDRSNSSSRAGMIRVYPHLGSLQRNSYQHRTKARFLFPPPSSDTFYCVWISLLCPTVTRSNTTQQAPAMIFDLAPDRLWLQLVLEIGGSLGLEPSSTVTLFISLGSIFRMASEISPMSSRIVEIPWDSWAKYTAWINTTDYLRPGAGCFYGSRAVYLRGTTGLPYYKAVVYDLSFRGTAPTGRIVSNSTQTSADMYMEAIFKGSRRPAIMSSFDLKEQSFSTRYTGYSQHPIAMLDEEHVIFHKPTLYGEERFLVYNL